MSYPMTTIPYDSYLDLDPWIGQRADSFRFDLVDGITGGVIQTLNPIRTATLSHDSLATIKRRLLLGLGADDSAAIGDAISSRIDVTMVLGNGATYPLGRYTFTDNQRQRFTSGNLGAVALTDEMFILDQPIEAGIDGLNKVVSALIQEVLEDFSFPIQLDSSPFLSTESWGIGINRGQVLEALAVSGDYFSPWFGNDKAIHFLRTFDPATAIPDFDFDRGNKVIRAPINETDDLLTAPNRFIVVSNAPTDTGTPVIGIADVPPNAPHSIQNRGFVIPTVFDLQLSDVTQAQRVAEGFVRRNTVLETTTLSTALDPRHDSYNVIRWDGAQWLEVGWSMDLVAGGTMTHTLRKAYT